jgi:molecular chaperone IbpA
MVSKQIFDTLSLPQILNYTIGFDRTFNRLESNLLGGNQNYQRQDNYPPYNIRKVDDFNYIIELAVAGFGKKDIDVKLADGTLSIKSNKDENNEAEEMLHKGISTRNFERRFTLADDIVIQSAKLKDGLLSIELEQIVPEDKKPRTIEIK